MKLYLCPNVYTEKQISEAVQCIHSLEKQGHAVSVSFEDAEIFKKESVSLQASTPAESDMIVSLGGDGAVLKASKLAIRENKKLFGINSGRLGFLCALEYEKVDSFNEALENSNVSMRDLLEVNLNGKTYLAVNDVIISKEKIGSSVDLLIQIEGLKNFHVRGDGVVVSTPTGSTAYNFSCGGPIIDPKLGVFVLTPLHPNQGLKSPVVSDLSNAIHISERNNEAVIVIDGISVGHISDDFLIRGSNKKLMIYEK